MATAIHTGATGTPDTGTWVQAATGYPSFVRVASDDPESRVLILISEAAGAGIGDDPEDVVELYGNDFVFLPAGTYQINADVRENPETLSVTVQN